jgi:hypothetical protein
MVGPLRCFEKRPNVRYAPGGGAWSEFYWLGEFPAFNASPPRGFADRDYGRYAALGIANNLRQAKKATFGKLVHLHPSLFVFDEYEFSTSKQCEPAKERTNNRK